MRDDLLLLTATTWLAAREVLARLLPPTPMAALAVLSERVGGPVFPHVREPAAHRLVQGPRRVPADLQAQRGGAGPRRGAASARQPRQGGVRGALLGVKATVDHAPRVPSCQRSEGDPGIRVRIISHGRPWTTAVAYAARDAAENGAGFIHPSNNRDIVAGQGTLGTGDSGAVPAVRHGRDPGRRGGVAAGVIVAVESADPWWRGAGGRPRRCGIPGAREGPATRTGPERIEHGRRLSGLHGTADIRSG